MIVPICLAGACIIRIKCCFKRCRLGAFKQTSCRVGRSFSSGLGTDYLTTSINIDSNVD